MLRRLWLKTKIWWIGPQEGIHADYETLVRLARRCAYDFSHASDYIKMPPYLSDIDYAARANMWISLFAKGNPGKDYRIKYMAELDRAEHDLQCLFKIIRENGLEDKVPQRVRDDCDKTPF